jgi:hypothetical protein
MYESEQGLSMDTVAIISNVQSIFGVLDHSE